MARIEKGGKNPISSATTIGNTQVQWQGNDYDYAMLRVQRKRGGRQKNNTRDSTDDTGYNSFQNKS